MLFEEWLVLMVSPCRSERVSLSAAFRTPELNVLGEKRYVANWDKILTSVSPYYLPLQH